jgi:hypothetical protein
MRVRAFCQSSVTPRVVQVTGATSDFVNVWDVGTGSLTCAGCFAPSIRLAAWRPGNKLRVAVGADPELDSDEPIVDVACDWGAAIGTAIAIALDEPLVMGLIPDLAI